jgi:hypothetical protein
VVSELGVAPPGAVLQHLGDPVLRLGPGLGRELGVEGFPDQRVPEPVHLADVPAGAEQADGGGFVAQPGHRASRGAQRRRDQDQAAANVGPIATLLYGFSLLYCMTTSLAEGGEGLSTLGLPEATLRDLAGQARFAQVRLVEMDNPFNRLYELTR